MFKAHIIMNRKDTILKPHDFIWENIIHEARHPQSIMDKSGTKLWMFNTLIDPTFKERRQFNYDEISILQLDYDDGTSLDSMRYLFRQFKCLIYSTFSSTPDHNRFRVLIPLANPIKYEVLKSKMHKEAVKRYFGNIDMSSFCNYQGMPVRNCLQPNNYFFCHSQNKKLFDIEVDLHEHLTLLRKVEEIDNALRLTIEQIAQREREFQKWFYEGNKKVENMRANYLAKAFKSFEDQVYAIPKTRTGSRYNDLLSIIGNMIEAAYPNDLGGEFLFDEDDVKRLIVSNTDNQSLQSAIESFHLRR